MVLPDPFTPNLKIDLLPEIQQAPRFTINFNAMLGGLKEPLDVFLKTSQPANFCKLLPSRLVNNDGKTVNTTLVNCLVVYLGVSTLGGKSQSMNSPEMEVVNSLMR